MEPHEIVTLIYSGAMCLIGLLSFVLGRRDRSNDEKKDDCEDSKVRNGYRNGDLRSS